MRSLLRLGYQKIARPFFFRMDAEKAHHLAMGTLERLSRHPAALTILRYLLAEQKPVEVFGLRFPNPVGLAAGFDKNAVALPAWEALGFGFAELGTITAQGQPGNPLPRVFRYPERGALINRMGFNNEGANEIAESLARWKRLGLWPKFPVGINIGKSKATALEHALGDYQYSFGRLAPYADYITLNVSSPNTPGLRELQERDALDELIGGIQKSNRKLMRPVPVVVKIAPDMGWGQIGEIIEIAEHHGLAGIIATNTTLDHSSIESFGDQQGGLSGAPLEKRATEIIRFICEKTKLPVIGVGGITDPDSARRKLDAGARLIQLYTGYIYGGPTLVPEIVESL
jgi:dihydroorotate dehydrogenase